MKSPHSNTAPLTPAERGDNKEFPLSSPVRVPRVARVVGLGGQTRWLVVRNPRREPFYGIGVLHADYRTRQIASVIVSDPEGKTVPSRIINETLGDLEADGKRRWAFDLEFFCDCGSSATVAYTARFGDDPASCVSEQVWQERLKEGMLPAVESETSRDEV